MGADYDAIIVGSGFGGGIAACRLAEAGRRVCVLERGRRFAPSDFIDRPEQAPKLLWHDRLNPGGMFDVRLMRDLTVITAAGVGGGSLVYANVQLPAPPDLFAQGWPSAITRAELDPWYARTEEALLPVVTPAQPPLDKIRAFRAAARLAGREPEPLPLAVYFDTEGRGRAHPFSGVHQEPCENCARCDIGCPRNARNTVDITYLARAEEHGAEVLPMHLVTGLAAPGGRGGRWRVNFRRLREGGRSGFVEAPLLVLSAGTLGTPRLLLLNRRRIPGLSPALGTRFSGNGDALGMALDPQATAVRGANNDFGPTMTSRIDYAAERKLMLADGGLPPHFVDLLDAARGVRELRRWERIGLRLRRMLIGLGLSDHQLAPRYLTLRSREPDADALLFLLMGRDAANGRMRLTPLFRRLDVSWNMSDSAALFAAADRTIQEVAQAAEATPFAMLKGGLLSGFTTVHPLGGCPMDDDPAHGVVDDVGRAHGVPGLRILDGSIVPTALGVNPSKTIAALAERGIAQLLAEGSD